MSDQQKLPKAKIIYQESPEWLHEEDLPVKEELN
jgi:hypothetical protein